MYISLPEDMRAFVEDQAAREGHASAGEYVCCLVREAQRRKAKLELEANLLEGLQGTPVKMDDTDWKLIEQEALRNEPRKRACN